MELIKNLFKGEKKQMAKLENTGITVKQSVDPVVVEQATVKSTAPMNNSALGVYRDDSLGHGTYCLVEIKYNPVTKQSGDVTVLDQGKLLEVIEKFKMTTAKRGLFS